MSGLAYTKLFPNDWRSDHQLQRCSLLARGAWIEMVCLMLQNVHVGFLEDDGKPMEDAVVADLIRTPLDVYRQCVAELEKQHVFSRDERGVIHSRRLVREHAKFLEDSGNGSKGGRPRKRKPRNNPPLSHARAGASGYGYDDKNGSVTSGSDPRDGEKAGPRRAPSRLEAHWEAEWQRSRGTPWAWVRTGKDGKGCPDAVLLAKCLKLASGDHAEVERRVTRMLASDVDWVVSSASPTVLHKHWNKFATDAPRSANSHQPPPSKTQQKLDYLRASREDELAGRNGNGVTIEVPARLLNTRPA